MKGEIFCQAGRGRRGKSACFLYKRRLILSKCCPSGGAMAMGATLDGRRYRRDRLGETTGGMGGVGFVITPVRAVCGIPVCAVEPKRFIVEKKSRPKAAQNHRVIPVSGIMPGLWSWFVPLVGFDIPGVGYITTGGIGVCLT
jgi:hypothetical protein